MNAFIVVLAILALGAVGTLVGAFVRRRKARDLTDISGSVDQLAEQEAAKRLNDMQGGRYGLLQRSLPPPAR